MKISFPVLVGSQTIGHVQSQEPIGWIPWTSPATASVYSKRGRGRFRSSSPPFQAAASWPELKPAKPFTVGTCRIPSQPASGLVGAIVHGVNGVSASSYVAAARIRLQPRQANRILWRVPEIRS
jgi:hypothetical protein